MASLTPRASSSAAPAALSRHGVLRRHGIKLIASVVITCTVVYTVHRGGLKFIPERSDFQGVRWWTLPLYWMTLFAMTWFRSTRWRFLLRSIAEVPRARLLAVSAIGFAAILLMPFRIGEIVRPYLIRTRPSDRRVGESTITMTAATSSVVAERIIDGLYLSIVLALALLLVPTVHPLPDRVVGIPIPVAQVRTSGYLMFALFCVLFATIAVFYFARAWAHKATLILLGRFSRKLAERLAGTFEKFADGLHVFGRGRDAFGFFVETTAYWGANAAGMWLLAWGCGVVHADGAAVTFGEACALMGMLGCTILIPGPPGMVGTFQAGIYSGMTMYFPTRVVIGAGAGYVFVMYLSQLVFQVAMGVWGLMAEGSGGGIRGGLGKLEEDEQGIAAAPVDA